MMSDILRLALFQPEIAQNVGTLIRLSACFGISLDVIEPTGFPWDNNKMRRGGMDYIDKADITRHPSFCDFFQIYYQRRIVLMDVKASQYLYDFAFKPGDILMMGRESDGVPDSIFDLCHKKIRIPMIPCVRSLNVAVSAAMGISEAVRQMRDQFSCLC